MATFNSEEREKKTFIQKATGALGVFFMVVVMVVMLGYGFFVKNNVAGKYTMIEPISGKGKFEPRMEPGRFWKGFNATHEWDRAATFWFSKEKNEGSAHDQSLPARYNDGGTATISGSVRYEIVYDETSPESKKECQDKFTALHVQYRDQENFKDRAIKTLVTEALTLTATLITAEESYTTNKAQFTEWALDQLNHGVYLTDTYSEDITLPNGEVKTIKKSEIKRDPKTNEPIRKEHSLKAYNVRFSQFVISDPDYHKLILDQIQGKLENLMGKVASQAEAELRAIEAETVKLEGERDVVQAEYLQKVKNIEEVIKAEIDNARIRIPAEAKNKVSEIKKKAAEHQKNADINDGQGEAFYKQALQTADSNMEVRLKLWLEGHKARASVLANNRKITPDIVLPQGSNQADTGMAILNYKALKEGLEK